LPQVDELTRRLPWLELHMYFGSGSDIVGRVRNMEIDCAVTSSLVMDPRLVGLRLHREDYVFVGATKLLRKQPFRTMADAEHFTLIDTDPTLALFRYMRDASHVDGGSSPSFRQVLCFGTIEAIRARVLSGAGVAVLPAYLVRQDLEEKRLIRIMPKQTLLHDYFRLIVRADDPRRALFDALAMEMAKVPLA
jgi:DNA-binding transcriptional LysR family regulator